MFLPLQNQITRTMKKLLTAIVLTLSAPSMAQNILNTFFAGTSEGVTYHLPDTEICVTVEACCVKQTPGEFYSYAERFLHMKDVISEAGNRWEITGMDCNGKGIPCKDKLCTIKLNNTANNIRLNEKGILQAINATIPEEPATAYKETRGTATDNKANASQYMTEEMLTATSTAKMAELTAKEIYAIRESKLAITRGQAENMPSDGAAISLLLQELDKQEMALTEMFTGRTDTVYHRFTFAIPPSEIYDTTKAVLFRFSHKLGVVDKENLAGEPVYYNLRNMRTVEKPATDETAKKKTAKQAEGISYNIPGRAKVEIYTRTRTFVEKEIAIAQFGMTEILSKTLFNKNKEVKVLFDTATGGIISIEKD